MQRLNTFWKCYRALWKQLFSCSWVYQQLVIIINGIRVLFWWPFFFVWFIEWSVKGREFQQQQSVDLVFLLLIFRHRHFCEHRKLLASFRVNSNRYVNHVLRWFTRCHRLRIGFDFGRNENRTKKRIRHGNDRCRFLHGFHSRHNDRSSS